MNVPLFVPETPCLLPATAAQANTCMLQLLLQNRKPTHPPTYAGSVRNAEAVTLNPTPRLARAEHLEVHWLTVPPGHETPFLTSCLQGSNP